VLAPSTVDAACAPANLAGFWDAYSVGAQDSELLWSRCSIRVSATARILSGSSCISHSGAASTRSGQLTVRGNCRVTGSFTQRLGGGDSLRCNISQATLSKDKGV
jgi:hypothetical protein